MTDLHIVPPVDYDTRPDLYTGLRDIHDGLLDRVANALGSERFLFFYFGIVAGCFLTVGFAALWSFYR